MYILYLDRYHLGDPLFLNGFARDVLNLDAPRLIVHGAGEAAERALEARGQIARWEDGVLVAETVDDRALVARAARNLNRQIAHTLNDAGVAAVPLEAGARGLFSLTETGLKAGKAEWLCDLVRRRAVPVMSALVPGTAGGVHEVNGGAVAGILAGEIGACGDKVAVLFLVKGGLIINLNKEIGDNAVALNAVPDDALAEPESVCGALRAGADVRLIERSELRAGAIRGVRVVGAIAHESP